MIKQPVKRPLQFLRSNALLLDLTAGGSPNLDSLRLPSTRNRIYSVLAGSGTRCVFCRTLSEPEHSLRRLAVEWGTCALPAA